MRSSNPISLRVRPRCDRIGARFERGNDAIDSERGSSSASMRSDRTCSSSAARQSDRARSIPATMRSDRATFDLGVDAIGPNMSDLGDEAIGPSMFDPGVDAIGPSGVRSRPRGDPTERGSSSAARSLDPSSVRARQVGSTNLEERTPRRPLRPLPRFWCIVRDPGPRAPEGFRVAGKRPDRGSLGQPRNFEKHPCPIT
jgi:hypothetical protein